MVAHGVVLNGCSTVLCGSLVPLEVDALPAPQFLGPILYAILDVPDDVADCRDRDWCSTRRAGVPLTAIAHGRSSPTRS
jgi:hypothetical protein